MKKLLSIILCLMMTLSVFASAEGAAPQLTIVDFGPFTMGVGADAHYEVADTMTSNTVYAIIYTDYLSTGSTTNNINVVYSADNVSAQIASSGGIEKYAELVLSQAGAQYEAMGVKMTNASILYTALEDNEGGIITTYTLDYTGAGYDMVATLYQLQAFFSFSATECYIFTLTADSMAQLEALTAYLDTLTFKTAETAAAEPIYAPVDFVYFTLDLSENDYYQVADERQDNTAYAIIYPNYDPTSTAQCNINVVWSSNDFALQVKLFGADLYAQSILKSTENLYNSMGYTLSNQQLHQAQLQDDVFTTCFSYDLAAGNQSMTAYQLQRYHFRGDDGVYCITLTATSMEELEALSFYLDTLVIK